VKALATVPKIFREHTIIMGDFNARVGNAEDGDEYFPILGSGIPSPERRLIDGIKLLNFCIGENLIIANSHHPNPCGSWHKRGEEGYTHTIDHVPISECLKAHVQHCGVVCDLPITDEMTDHLPTILNLRVPTHIAQPAKKDRSTPRAAQTGKIPSLNYRALTNNPSLCKLISKVIDDKQSINHTAELRPPSLL